MTPLSDLKPDPGLLVIHALELWNDAFEVIYHHKRNNPNDLLIDELARTLRRCCKEPREVMR